MTGVFSKHRDRSRSADQCPAAPAVRGLASSDTPATRTRCCGRTQPVAWAFRSRSLIHRCVTACRALMVVCVSGAGTSVLTSRNSRASDPSSNRNSADNFTRRMVSTSAAYSANRFRTPVSLVSDQLQHCAILSRPHKTPTSMFRRGSQLRVQLPQ